MFLSRFPEKLPYQYTLLKSVSGFSHFSLQRMFKGNNNAEVTGHSRKRCKKVSLWAEPGIIPIQNLQLSVIFGRICDNLSPVRRRLVLHLKINSLKSLSRKEQPHPEMKFFVTISFGIGDLTILENPLTVVISRTVRDWTVNRFQLKFRDSAVQVIFRYIADLVAGLVHVLLTFSLFCGRFCALPLCSLVSGGRPWLQFTASPLIVIDFTEVQTLL
jgi:hypothetical protein